MSELAGELCKVFDLFRIGIVVGAIDERVAISSLPKLVHKRCHSLVGEKHEFFDQLIRVLSNFGYNSQRFSFWIKLKLDFGCFKIYGTVLEPFFSEFDRKVIQNCQLVCKLSTAGFYDFLRALVRESMI